MTETIHKGKKRYRCDHCKQLLPEPFMGIAYQERQGDPLFHFCNATQYHKWFHKKYQLRILLGNETNNPYGNTGVNNNLLPLRYPGTTETDHEDSPR